MSDQKRAGWGVDVAEQAEDVGKFEKESEAYFHGKHLDKKIPRPNTFFHPPTPGLQQQKIDVAIERSKVPIHKAVIKPQ